MIDHRVGVQRTGERLAREDQLAFKLAVLAADAAPLDDAAAAVAIDRVIDNAAAAAASLTRGPVVTARQQALAHPRAGGATVLGCASQRLVEAEWAAWANEVAVRELDFHDTFLAKEYAHPGDNIAPLVAVAQQCGRSGDDLLAAIVTAYEVQVDLAKAISLHAHRIDHVAHLGPSVAAGIGRLLGLSVEVIYQAIGQSLHLTTATRQSRKGEISSWKAYAPAFAGKVAIEAVDRAMRGEGAPSPIYEGEDGVIARMLDGPEADYVVSLPAPGEERRAILETYTKEYSAEYQAQAFIDLAKKVRGRIGDLAEVESVLVATSHHTHTVIGTGAGDPEKLDPDASRETLDHSLMYILAVALEDGGWHHERSYAPERAHRPSTIALWHKITTIDDPEWSRRYLELDPQKRAFGGRLEIKLRGGETIVDELAVADAHPQGARPFARPQYRDKFVELSSGVIDEREQQRFLDLAEHLAGASAEALTGLTITALDAARLEAPSGASGIF